MSDSFQEKSEAPTQRRRDDAFNDGQVPRSPEMTTAIMLLGSVLVLKLAGPVLARHLLSTMGYGLVASGNADLDAGSATTLLQHVGFRTLAVLTLVLGGMAAIVVTVSAIQARGVFSPKPLGPNWERLNPVENAKKMFGIQPVAELIKSFLKVGIVALAVYHALGAAWPDIVALVQESPGGLLEVIRRYSFSVLTTAGIAYLTLAAADYVYQLWRHEKNLRMTKEEVKQELKSSEGDPMVKARMRSLGRARARAQMMKDVKQADVVITNPTHIAVALKYDTAIAPAPLVLAMGERKVAQRIKQLAFEAGIPVIENKPLARALFASARVGSIIPAELYLAVAEILAFVIRRRAAHNGVWKGTALV
jgi:flagellar biosynthesis protein FlhB